VRPDLAGAGSGQTGSAGVYKAGRQAGRVSQRESQSQSVKRGRGIAARDCSESRVRVESLGG